MSMSEAAQYMHIKLKNMLIPFSYKYVTLYFLLCFLSFVGDLGIDKISLF